MIKNISNLSKIKWLSVAISLIPVISMGIFSIAAYFTTHLLSIWDFLSRLFIALAFLIFTLLYEQLSNSLLILFSITTRKIAVATKLLICSVANTTMEFYLTYYWLPKSVAANDTTATYYALLVPTLPLAVTLVLYVLLTIIFRITKIMPSEK